ncbi:MAG: diaminopropionate ammonia-lyase [bacterium]
MRPAPPPPPPRDPYIFHASLPGYAPTPLLDLPELAVRCGVERLWLKDESSRLGLPSFKILGASWACYRAVAERMRLPPADAGGIDDLRVKAAGEYTLLAATDGNHGRAVARVARWLGLDSRIFVPENMAQRRIDAIAGEGAEVIVVRGAYDDAIAAAAAAESSDREVLVSDMAWDGYQVVPNHVIDGYSTIFREVDGQLPDGEAIDVVVVQVGVGALAASVVQWTVSAPRGVTPKVVTVEPTDAACLRRSLENGFPTAAPPPHRSIMAGLNCGNVSSVAWPLLAAAVDVALTVDDETTSAAVAAMEALGLHAGATGAAGVAGLFRLAHDPALDEDRRALGRHGLRVLALVTEGRT